MPVTHEVASSSLVVPAIKRSHLVWLFLMAELIVARSVFCEFGGFADGWSERSEQIRIANRLSRQKQSFFRRNSVSVEQIQDKPRRSRHFKDT